MGGAYAANHSHCVSGFIGLLHLALLEDATSRNFESADNWRTEQVLTLSLSSDKR
jgi:hypothetical protein